MIGESLIELGVAAAILLAAAHMVSSRIEADLWLFGLYALASCAAIVGILMVTDSSFEVVPFILGAGVLAGVYWASTKRPHIPLDVKGHLTHGSAGLGVAALLTMFAVAYRWWMVPALVVTVVVAALTVSLRSSTVKASPAGLETATPSPAATLEASFVTCPHCHTAVRIPAILVKKPAASPSERPAAAKPGPPPDRRPVAKPAMSSSPAAESGPESASPIAPIVNRGLEKSATAITRRQSPWIARHVEPPVDARRGPQPSIKPAQSEGNEPSPEKTAPKRNQR